MVIERIKEILSDCEKLKRKGMLTEYGEGQRDLCMRLLGTDKKGKKA